MNGTRQIEFAKKIPDDQRYGNMLLSPPADWTYLRLVKRARTDPLDSKRDLDALVRRADQEGLVAMHGSGVTAEFDYICVAPLQQWSPA